MTRANFSTPPAAPSRVGPATTYVGFALAAAILQILATAKLGLTPVAALERIAQADRWAYIGAGLGVAALATLAFLLRRRAVLAALVVVVGAIPLGLWGWRTTSVLGWAFHGEATLHHFATLTSAAALAAIAGSWGRRAELSWPRWIPVALLAVGLPLVLFQHVAAMPMFAREPWWFGEIGTALLLLSPLAALAALWPRLGPPRLRLAEAALLVPLFARVGLAWPSGLSGAPVWESGRAALMASIVVVSAVVFVLYRPAETRPLRGLALVFAAVAAGLLYLIYQRSFGGLEDSLGGLAQSFFGFPLPYPQYVDRLAAIAVAVGGFLVFGTVCSGLMTWTERDRGLALALMMLAGLGLSTPQLVLMTCAAHLLWIDTLTEHPLSTVRTHAATEPIESILEDVARRLGLPAPVVLDRAGGRVVALRGEVAGAAVDLRARSADDATCVLDVRLGMLGRGRPDVELRPGRGGQRLPHPRSQTHRVHGSVRALERLGDAAFDAIEPFPDLRLRLWPAGSETTIGPDLRGLDAPRLVALVRALTEGP